MEEENIDLARFNFNVDDVVKGAAVLKETIDGIRANQAQLRKDNKTSTIEFVEGEAALKTLNAEYRRHIKALSDTQKAAQRTAVREQLLDKVLGAEVNTIKEAREQNKVLNELRNDANVTTEKGREEIRQLNEQLDSNNELIKENADQYLAQKINIGNYTESIIEAFEILGKQKKQLELNIVALTELRDTTEKGSKEWEFYNSKLKETQDELESLEEDSDTAGKSINAAGGGVALLSGGLKGLILTATSAGGVTALLTGLLKGLKTQIISVTKAALGFIATPVGAILAIIAGAFLLVKNAMARSEEATNSIKRAFAPFQGILKAVLGLLEPVGEFLIDGIVKGLELAQEAIFMAIDAFADLADFLGFDTLADSARAFNQEIQQGAADAVALAEAEAKLTRQQREARLVQLEYQKEAEKLRQLRDDESSTIEERIRANQELGAVLEQQLQDELRIANTALEVAQLRLKADGESAEALDAQAEALENIADIEERITGQRSEQLTNRVSLEKEAADKAREAADKRIEGLKEELALFTANQGLRAKTLAEELAQEREASDLRLQILKDELANKKISQTAYNAEVINLRNELAQKEAELAVEEGLRAVDLFRQNLERQREDAEFLSQEVLERKKRENNALFEIAQAQHELELEQGVINQNEFDEAIREASESNRLANKELDLEREETEKEEALELRALEFEEELERMREESATRFELEQEIAQEHRDIELAALEEERSQELISQELFDARKKALLRNFAKAEADIDIAKKAAEKQREEALAKQKFQIATGLLSAAAQVIDSESAAGKAVALAQAGINTFQGITAGVKLGYPQAIPAVAAASATGFAAVRNILKTDVPSASGAGNVGGGGSAPAGASSSGFGGANLGSTANLTAIASSGNAAVQEQLEQSSGSRNVAEEVGRAAEEGTRRGAEEGTNTGMVDLSENRQIRLESEF